MIRDDLDGHRCGGREQNPVDWDLAPWGETKLAGKADLFLFRLNSLPGVWETWGCSCGVYGVEVQIGKERKGKDQ